MSYCYAIAIELRICNRNRLAQGRFWLLKITVTRAANETWTWRNRHRYPLILVLNRLNSNGQSKSWKSGMYVLISIVWQTLRPIIGLNGNYSAYMWTSEVKIPLSEFVAMSLLSCFTLWNNQPFGWPLNLVQSGETRPKPSKSQALDG